MALEQWEINLRKQLEGKVNQTPPGKEPEKGPNWEDKLVQQIQDNPSQPVKKANNTIIMLVLLIVLGLATLFAYDSKNGGKIQNWISSQFSSKEEVGTVQPQSNGKRDYDAEIAALRSDIRRVEADNKASVEKLATKVKWNSDRINLMAIMLNENFLILRNGNNKGHMIFFNRDWTLDNMPQYIELSDDDKVYLKKFVKP